ncbi:MAG TPA: hypothetical protein VFY49_06745 [Myxococcota bacterium]|nr:hypothetical protein [Myxococcota bacterium]
MRRALRALGIVAGVAVAAYGALWLAARARAPEAEPALAATPAPAPPAAPEAPAAADAEGSPELDPLRGTWEHVDMEAMRRALPDNLYWTLAVPSDDPRVQEQREAERAHWNDEYGKVLSGTATDAEIDAYYDHRYRVSSDYVEITRYLLSHHQGELPEQDVALIALAERLQLARLAELPRKLEESRERKRQQDAAREAWKRDEAAFAGQPEE